MSTTVAIVVKDRREAMARCLQAVAVLSPAPDEVIVVDNGSTDGTLALVRRAGVRVIEQRGPLGAARQAAVDACTTEWLAFTDSDCRPRVDWLGALLAVAAGCDVVQGRTVPAAPAAARWAATQDISAFTDLYECCNLLYRTDALRRAGGFSASDGFFGEDTSAGWRVRRLGGRSQFASDAVVEHDTTQPGMAWHLRRAYGYSAFPRLVRQFPEMRDELLWHRYLLRPRSLPAVMAALGVLAAAGGRRALPLVAAAPWLWAHRPDRGGAAGLSDAAGGLAYDAAALAGLVVGSVKERRVVL